MMVESWVVPCNVNVFDPAQHFKEQNEVVWKRGSSIKQGDVVFIYVGAPYSEISFRCRVCDDRVDERELLIHQYAVPAKLKAGQRYMKLCLEKAFKRNEFPLKDLREHGLGQVQIQARVDRRLKRYLEEKNAYL